MKRLFTLIELIIVIVVIGVLAAIVIPNISFVKEDAVKVAIEGDIRNIQTAIDMEQLETKNKPTPKIGEPKEIDYNELVPNTLRGKPEHGKFWIDHNNIVYGATIELPSNVTMYEDGLVTWVGDENAVLHRVYTQENSIKSNASKVKLTLVEETTETSYQGEENKSYLIASQDKYGNWTPPVNENFVPSDSTDGNDISDETGEPEEPKEPEEEPEPNIVVKHNIIGAGHEYAVKIKEDGTLEYWGYEPYNSLLAKTPKTGSFKQISIGKGVAVGIKEDGSLHYWADDYTGGEFLPGYYEKPTGNDFVDISAGTQHFLALRSDGSIFAWGVDLGNNGVLNTPKSKDFKGISAGGGFSFGLKEDGSIVAWGDDYDGQVSQAPKGNDFKDIEAGLFFGVALKEDGSIVAWGDNSYGQVSQIPKGNDFVAISAGDDHAIALKKDGTIVAWGSDDYGNVSEVPTEGKFVSISAGSTFSIALTENGEVVEWGELKTDAAG